MEVIIVIAIVVLAAAYVARNFYLKFKKGKSYNGSSSCATCGCADTCNDRQVVPDCPDTCDQK
jgi:hypothetical protein